MNRADESQAEEIPKSTDERPSRGELTRAAAEVNRLGVQLTMLSATDLDRLELPGRLREEIAVSQALKPRARGRQNRLIGQLLRAEDHDAIRARFESLRTLHKDRIVQEKAAERWLARLMEGGATAVEALMVTFPHADRQRLRQLVRNVSRAPEARVAKRARRELLRAIRALQDPSVAASRDVSDEA